MHENSMYDADYIRNRIESLLEHRGVSARSMSISIGKSETYISNILLGRCLPNYDTFLSICKYFCVTPAQFFDESQQYPTSIVNLLTSYLNF